VHAGWKVLGRYGSSTFLNRRRNSSNKLSRFVSAIFEDWQFPTVTPCSGNRIMSGHEFQSFMNRLKEAGEAGLKFCRSLEIGQAIQPCSEALAQMLSDGQPKSLTSMPFSTACEWITVPLKQAQGRAGRELGWLRDRIAGIEPQRLLNPARITGSDKDSAKLKEQLAAGFSKIDKSMTMTSETSIQPLGSWTRFLREATGDFDLCDMEKTQSSTTLRLGINAGHLSKITRRIEHELRTQLNLDLRRLQDDTARVQRKTLTELGVAESELDRFTLPKSAERDVWRSIENLIAVGKESQIEFQRRSVFDILTAGRQKVFMVIMFLSLMGRMGLPNLFVSPGSKLIFGLFLGAVMLSSMLSSIFLWRREKIEQGEKELKKIRETLLQDGVKIVEQSERNKLTAIREYLKETLAATESSFKAWSEEAGAAAKTKFEATQTSKESYRKALDARVKLATEAERELSKLIERVSDLAKQDAARVVAPIPSMADTTVAVPDSTPESKTVDKGAISPTHELRASLPVRALPQLERSSNKVSGLAARREQRLAAQTK
jgi:hypothetical protein